MDKLPDLVGRERSLAEVAQAHHFAATAERASAVGALHVTCADETEHECVEAFQRGVVHFLLPSLKSARRGAMRLANLGGRYEWNAARVAEQHYATPLTHGGWKLLLIKINTHVGFEELPGQTPPYRFGRYRRYGVDSPVCSALDTLLAGATQPFAEELREAMRSEGKDRLAALLDPARVPIEHRALFAAILVARLQARTALLDVQDYVPMSPTRWAIVACVTINRPGKDGEIVVGLYTLDSRDGGASATWSGFGDDPADYRLRVEHGRFIVSDPHVGAARLARDHRALTYEEWKRASGTASSLELHDPRLDHVRAEVAGKRHRGHHRARHLLRIALPILAEVAPVPAAVLAFAEGAAGIHHAYRVHRLAREMQGTTEAREILDEIHGRVDQLPEDRAEALIELLMREYRGP